MPNDVLMSIAYGDYISMVKLIAFIVLFFGSLPLIQWIADDAKTIDTKDIAWTAAIAVAVFGGGVLCLAIPEFAIGLSLYIVAVLTVAIAYVIHRNSIVPDYDRVLTPDHIMSLLSSGNKTEKKQRAFSLITVNNNEVPVPPAKTPENYSYRATEDFLTDIILKRAESVKFIPSHNSYSIIYNIDGISTKQPVMEKSQIEPIILLLKNLGDLDLKEKRKPQKSKFTVRQENELIEWKITTAGSTAGEQILLKRQTECDDSRAEDIGLTLGQLKNLKTVRTEGEGVIIISGPAKSGLTTTMYSLLRNHDAFLNSIHTLERSPSMTIKNITQERYSLSDSSSATFGETLEAMVRMEPDIIGVCECKDAKTAGAICNAGLNRKIVYVIIEAENSAIAFAKWMQAVGDKKQACQALTGILNQKLLRKLCPECRQPYSPNTDLLRKFNLPASKIKALYRAGKVQYDKHGKPRTCDHCQGTGFYGRTGVFEGIFLTDQMKKRLRKITNQNEITPIFRSAKMKYLQEEALRKIVAGVISVNEMLRVFSAGKPKKIVKKTK